MIMGTGITMEITSTPMAEFCQVKFSVVIPALSGDPLACRDADLEILKLPQTESRVHPGSETGMTSAVFMASGGYQ
jgi:hypothetical protein